MKGMVCVSKKWIVLCLIVVMCVCCCICVYLMYGYIIDMGVQQMMGPGDFPQIDSNVRLV